MNITNADGKILDTRQVLLAYEWLQRLRGLMHSSREVRHLLSLENREKYVECINTARSELLSAIQIFEDELLGQIMLADATMVDEVHVVTDVDLLED